MFNLTIVTLEETYLDQEVHSVVLPGSEGYFQILTNHAPLISLVKEGRVEVYQTPESKELYAVSGGFFEVSNNKATLVADAIERASEIDYERAKKSLEKAKERLALVDDEEIDIDRAKKAALRAENRIKIYRLYHESQ
jgi:F-type H+-transporting ATPase subunit epsilon